jgi:hypothetical protein
MPYLTGLIDDGTGILRTGVGVLTGDEILDAAHAALHLPIDMKRVNHTLIDLSQVTKFKANHTDMARIVRAARNNVIQLQHGYYIAIAAPDESVFEACQVFKAIEQAPGNYLQIFPSLPEAREWLRTALPRA